MGVSWEANHFYESVQIIYVLTEKGKALAEALHPIEAWAQSYVDLTDQRTAK